MAVYLRVCGRVFTCTLPWMYIAMYPRTSGRVSIFRIWLCAMFTWLCIHVHMDVYTPERSIHMVMYPLTSGRISTCRIWLCAMRMWPCIHVHTTVNPRTRGRVSTCMWPCIHVHVTMYLCARGRASEPFCVGSYDPLVPHPPVCLWLCWFVCRTVRPYPN